MNKKLIIDIIMTVIWLSVSAGIGWFTASLSLHLGIEIGLCVILIVIWVYVMDIIKKKF